MPRPLADRLPLRIVWAGPLGGDGAAVPVHAGGVDAALAAVAPRLVVSVPGLGDGTLAPTSLADLRPRRAARALPAVRALLDLAHREAEGAGDDALAATGAPEPWVRRARQREAASPGATAVDRLMQIAGPDEPASFGAAVEAEVARVGDAVARDADFSGLERAWRSLAWLARRLDLRGETQLTAVPVDLDRLAESPALRDALAGADLLVVDAEVGPSAADVGRAGRWAALGAEAGVPVLASAAPALVGAESPSAPVPPVRHGSDVRFAAWTGLRARAEARWLALAYPPVRLVPDRDVWGGGALAVAADVGRAHARGDGPAALGRAPVRDLDADALAVALAPDVAADLGRGGVCAVVPDGAGARLQTAPSAAAATHDAARDAALSLPATLFAARVAAVAGAAPDGLRPALDREVGPWARVETASGGVRVTLPAGASRMLAADVSLLLRTA
jgi:hypothetical protein